VPNEAYRTQVKVFNEPSELALLLRFLEHIKEVKPFIITSYNGDRFDFPYIDARLVSYNIGLEKEVGLGNNGNVKSSEYFGRYMVHMDCFPWVERDSYLPQGSHNLKAVTRAKLHYDPVEVDPEEMVPLAIERPHEMCQYSVSDAVATYYLYMKHIHDFIFALCTIIPLAPDDVLRRGSGTLCENVTEILPSSCSWLKPS
jgi:DNA polymerase epsilon subunit 1